MEEIGRENADEPIRDIQYCIQFDDSEDVSSSELSEEEEVKEREKREEESNDIKCMSESKPFDDVYHGDFDLDFEAHLKKATSNINFSLPKIEFEQFENYNNLLEKNLINQEDDIWVEKKHHDEILLHEQDPEICMNMNTRMKFGSPAPGISHFIDHYENDRNDCFRFGNKESNAINYISKFEEPEHNQSVDLKRIKFDNIFDNNNESNSGSISSNKSCPNGKAYSCTVEPWDKTFKDNSSLRKHVQTHNNKQYICRYKGCGKKFLDNSKLKRHQLVHTGEKPFKWKIWGKKFSLDFNLRTHYRTHTGEKPYIWEFPEWGKRFTQSSNLTAHLKTHWGKDQAGNSMIEDMSYYAGRYGSSYGGSSQANDYESIENEDNSSHYKIFNIYRIQKQNLMLMRNKIPKVFWVHKYKPGLVRKDSAVQVSSEDYWDTPIRRMIGKVYKIERFPNHHRRINVKENVSSKIHPRICNDYSDNISFKIEKIPRSCDKPFALKRFPAKKTVDIESASTKRSSRESSKQKENCLSKIQSFQIPNLNLVKVEHEEQHIEEEVYSAMSEQNELHTLNQMQNMDLQNMDLQHEIQAFKFHEQLNEDVEYMRHEMLHPNFQLQFELFSSYQDHDFDMAHEEKPSAQVPWETEKAPFRFRAISGCNELGVIEVNENNSFLFGNERETPNFEPFVANKLFSQNFTLDNQ
jgi:hypothetical protein